MKTFAAIAYDLNTGQPITRELALSTTHQFRLPKGIR